MEYQYNDLIHVIDNWDTDGNIELRLLKDIDLDKLTYDFSAGKPTISIVG